MHTPTPASTSDVAGRDHRSDASGSGYAAVPRRSRGPDDVVFPPAITVRRWDDPLVEQIGFDVRDPYVELVWLPVVGPSATWALRALGAWGAVDVDGVTVPLAELGEALGLSRCTSSHDAAVQRTLRRLVRFGLAEWNGSTLRVRAVVPPVSSRNLLRLSPRVRRLHERMVTRRATRGADAP